MLALSHDNTLVYVLAESGVRGHLTSGRIERDPADGLIVFDTQGTRFDYLSGKRLRSWCVVDALGRPVDGWREILAEDLPKILRGP